ncbi:Uncharacterized protein PHPALM_31068 [Phytophthora palmivora]|uniref:Uncharacterized protein n=1 Tax=Phytophthora palmivora TaxID=4796 RepID=A0A2P4X3I9_9STRA|nr:Uncharacterized protein PHPALM_31068 [Phytophthora palmivora]
MNISFEHQAAEDVVTIDKSFSSAVGYLLYTSTFDLLPKRQSSPLTQWRLTLSASWAYLSGTTNIGQMIPQWVKKCDASIACKKDHNSSMVFVMLLHCMGTQETADRYAVDFCLLLGLGFDVGKVVSTRTIRQFNTLPKEKASHSPHVSSTRTGLVQLQRGIVQIHYCATVGMTVNLFTKPLLQAKLSWFVTRLGCGTCLESSSVWGDLAANTDVYGFKGMLKETNEDDE